MLLYVTASCISLVAMYLALKLVRKTCPRKIDTNLKWLSCFQKLYFWRSKSINLIKKCLISNAIVTIYNKHTLNNDGIIWKKRE